MTSRLWLLVGAAFILTPVFMLAHILGWVVGWWSAVGPLYWVVLGLMGVLNLGPFLHARAS